MKKLLLSTGLVALFLFLSSAIYARDIITFTWEGKVIRKSFGLHATNGKTFTIDWGDGEEATPYTSEGINTLIQPAAYGDNEEYTVTVTADEGCTFTDINLAMKEVVSLEVDHAPNLTTLVCSNNEIASLDISKNLLLTRFWCYNNALTSIEVSKNTALTDLMCNNNKIATLDVSKNTELIDLSCGNNALTSLDVSNLTKLEQLRCGNNALTGIDVSKNTALTYLYCADNAITGLDLSNNIKLYELYCYNNKIPLYDLYLASEMIPLAERKYLGTQTMDKATVKTGVAYPLTGLTRLADTQSVFKVLRNSNYLPEGEYYTIDYTNETITFVYPWSVTLHVTNAAISSFTSTPARIDIPFAVTDGTATETTDIAPISIYPNPATDAIAFTFDDNYTLSAPESNLFIYNTNGKMILTQSVASNEKVEITHLPAGVYFYRLITASGTKTGKIVKR